MPGHGQRETLWSVRELGIGGALFIYKKEVTIIGRDIIVKSLILLPI